MLKFAKKDSTSEMLEELITEEAHRRSIPSVNSTFDPIHITECSRRMVYRSRGIKHKSSLGYLQRASEDACRKKWLDIFKNSLKIRLIDQGIVVADSKYNITGKVDALISFGNNDKFAIKIKSVSESDFGNIKETGALRKDVVESILYLWLLEIKNGLLIYDNNNGGFVVFHVEPYAPIIKSVKQKCDDMIRQNMEGHLPERSYKESSSVECEVCEFNKSCWNIEGDYDR